jgi:AAA+ superfamily predicted ATPase
VEEAKEELQEIIEFLREPQNFRSWWAHSRACSDRRAGTGKTLLARANV